MSLVAIQTTPGRTRPRAFHIDTGAVGNYSLEIATLLDRANTEIGKAAQNWEPQIAAALAMIQAECSAPDWDGQQACAVSPQTLHQAERVARLFYCFVPRDTPPPEVIPEADGEVSLSWTRDKNRTFSVSIGSHDNLNYAGQLGGGAAPHDVARFDPQDPSTIQRMASLVSQLYR